MSKHTRGPWTIEEAKGHYRILGRNITTGVHLIAQLLQHGQDWFTSEDQANAHLIAAAPELLEALKAILSMNPSPHDDGDHNDFTDLIIKAERLIVKVEGKVT